MIRFSTLAFLALLSVPAIAQNGGFHSFIVESTRATEALNCRSPELTEGNTVFGALYGCIQGRAETAKFFINEDADQPDRVSNVKVIWNDWHYDTGYGLHADSVEAAGMIEALASLYAPKLTEHLIDVFNGDVDRIIDGIGFRFEFTFFHGPSIDERMIVVTER